MTSDKDAVKPEGFGHTGLPVKVTGVVFWGLALVGLLFSFIQLNDHKQQMAERQLLVVDHFYSNLRRFLTTEDNVTLPSIIEFVNEARGELPVSMVEIEWQGQPVRLGMFADDLVSFLPPESLTVTGMGQIRQPLLVALYLPSIESQAVEYRKRYLATMGGLFLLFGFVLQWVLQRMLSRPFLQMVEAAEAFSAGRTDVRFNASRRDEFGYLGGFINRALDYVTRQQNELQEALDRVRESEVALYDEKERAVVTLHSIGDAVITTDPGGTVDYLNPVAEKLTGWTLAEAEGRHVTEVMRLVNEVTQEMIDNPIELCLQSGDVVEPNQETMLVRCDGDEVAITDSAAPIRDRNGNVIGAILVFHDVGHTRKLARQLSYQAAHDGLTGLYNRREFERRVQAALESAQQEEQEHALCYLDLDQFKVVNDVCGHTAGDELLRQLSTVLHERVRETDVLARLGGDEFGVLLSHCTLAQARHVAEDIRRTVRGFRFMYEDHSFEIGVSIGLVPINSASLNVTEVLSAADVACYAAKDSGRNRIHMYEPDDQEMQKRRGELSWVTQITKAMEQDRMCLHYQPIVPVLDETRPVHYEMLVRMRDEAGKEVPPMAFIPAAERYNLMPAVDRWVVGTMLDTFGPGKAGPTDGIYVANLSGQSLGDESFLGFVVESLQESALDPHQVCFEITETAAIANLRGATHFIKVLRNLGCRFALDDFGSGLSSFGYLKNLEVDYLKIDGGFVKDMVTDDIDSAMVSAINEIGHVMGITTIAEFVEDEKIMAKLRSIGVDYAQGYWLAAPRSIDFLAAQGRTPVLRSIS